MNKTGTRLCTSPTHYQDSPGQDVRYEAPVRGRPSPYCPPCRRALVVNKKRRARSTAHLVKATWQAPTWLPEGSRIAWDGATAVITLPAPLSLDAGFESTEDGQGTLLAQLADLPQSEDSNMLHSAINIDLPFEGIRARFALREARAISLPDNTSLLHDGVNGSIIRTRDGADVTAIVLREAYAGHEGAIAIMEWFTGEATQDKVHAWLEALRDAAASGQLAGEIVPVIPADAGPISLN